MQALIRADVPLVGEIDGFKFPIEPVLFDFHFDVAFKNFLQRLMALDACV